MSADRDESDKFRTQFDEIWERTKSIMERGRDELVRATKASVAQLEKAKLVHDQNKLFQKLGEVAFELVDQGRIAADELRPAVDKIKEVMRRIEAEGGKVAAEVKAASDAGRKSGSRRTTPRHDSTDESDL